MRHSASARPGLGPSWSLAGTGLPFLPRGQRASGTRAVQRGAGPCVLITGRGRPCSVPAWECAAPSSGGWAERRGPGDGCPGKARCGRASEPQVGVVATECESGPTGSRPSRGRIPLPSVKLTAGTEDAAACCPRDLSEQPRPPSPDSSVRQALLTRTFPRPGEGGVH